MLKKQIQHSEMSLKKMNEILESVTNNESGDFFEYALRSICESRRAIVWTYPYGYFLVHKPKRNLYTLFQQQLEHTLETIAKMIEVADFEKFREK